MENTLALSNNKQKDKKHLMTIQPRNCSSCIYPRKMKTRDMQNSRRNYSIKMLLAHILKIYIKTSQNLLNILFPDMKRSTNHFKKAVQIESNISFYRCSVKKIPFF